jgi:hypothetical protein
MKCFLIEVIEPESKYFLSEIDGRFFWSGAANSTKMPKVYTEYKDADRVIRSTNTYLTHDANKRIVEATLSLSKDAAP